MENLKKILNVFLRVIISIALLIFLFKQVDTKSLFQIIKNADKALLFIAFFITFFSYVLCLLRWEMLLKAVKIHLPLKRVIISFSGGIFFSLFLPSTIGGDLMRSIDLATHTKRPKEVIVTVLLDRLSGYIGLVILALASLLLGWNLLQDTAVFLSVGIISGILVAILLVLFNRYLYAKISRILTSPNAGRIRELVRSLHRRIHIFRHRQGIIAYNLFFSLLIQSIAPIAFFVTALALGLRINIIYFFIILPIVGAITLLPISLGGLGLRDATIIYFFSKIGVAKDLAFAMSLLNFSFILIYGAIGGIIYVLTVHHRRVQHHAPSHLHKRHL